MRTPAILAFLVLFGFTVAPAHAEPTPLATALTGAVAQYDLAGGVAVVREGPQPQWQSAGYADVDTRAEFVPHSHIRVASITKTFVAATVLQLVAEGRVGLDAPIESYLPGRLRGAGIDANAITVRQLLRHQSGLPEYYDETTQPPVAPVTPDQLIGMALARPAQFAPGAEMKYTNTNYIVAGQLISAVTGAPAGAEISRRIIVPLGLSDTYFPAPGDTGLRAPFAHGYGLADGRRTDVTTNEPSAEDMAGSLVSSSEDTTAFITALLDGRVIPPAQLTEMTDAVDWPELGPNFRYGLGLASIALPCGVTVWGHAGGMPGYQSLMVKPFTGPAVSMTFNQSPPRESSTDDPRAAVLNAVYCPTG